MPLLLNSTTVNEHWKKTNAEIEKIFNSIESLEHWTISEESITEEFSAIFNTIAAESLTRYSDEFLKIMSYLPCSKALRVLNWIDENFPGVSFYYVMEARQEETLINQILLDRLKTIKNCNILGSIFSPSRTRLIASLLLEEDDAVTDPTNQEVIQIIAQYPSVRLPDMTAHELSSHILELKENIDESVDNKDSDAPIEDVENKGVEGVKDTKRLQLEKTKITNDIKLVIDFYSFFIYKIDDFECMTPSIFKAKAKELIAQYGKEEKNIISVDDSDAEIDRKSKILKNFNLLKLTSDDVIEKSIQAYRDTFKKPEAPKFIACNLFSESDEKTFISENQDTKMEVIEKFITKKLKNKSLKDKKLVKSDSLLESMDKLYQNFPHFSQVIEYLEDYCHLQNAGNGVFYIPPTLFTGGAGVGKTFFTHEVAKLLNTHFEVLNMESMTASWILVGSSAGWQSAAPGKIFNALIHKETMNPIFLLDEVDKCTSGNYSPENTLLPLLEQFTARSFTDECIPLKIDASNIIWFATANDEHKISIPLKSRFNTFKISDPNERERRALISNIYKSILANNSWGQGFESEISSTTLDMLSSEMTSGARDMRKIITNACAKAVRSNRRDIRQEDLEKISLKKSSGIGF